MQMRLSNGLQGGLLLLGLVIVGAVLYFGFFNSPAPQTADTNKAPASKSPAKEHILGLDTATPDTQTFFKQEYDRQNAECQKASPGAELAMGVYGMVRDTYAIASLGCGDTGTSAYYAKVNGQWQLAFKAEEVPNCTDVNAAKFTKEAIPECMANDEIKENLNP